MTTICTKCRVELDEEMKRCPLCGTRVDGAGGIEPPSSEDEATGLDTYHDHEERHLLQRILWQVTATLLLSGIVATIIIDYARHKTITWSLYPVTVCLILLSYASVFAFWQAKPFYRIVAGWFLSSILLALIDRFFAAAQWATGLGIPLLFSANVVTLTLLAVFRITKRKGLNLLAYTFVSIAILCISIEAIISKYFRGIIDLEWSIIVAACLLPVSAALIFIFFRTWNNPKLQKIFHT